MLRAICCKTQRNVSLMWLSSPAFCWLNLLWVEYRNVYKTTISWLFPAQKFSIFRHETSLGMSRFEGQSSIFPGMAGAGVAAAAVCHAWHSAGKTTGSQCHCQLTTSTCGSHSSHHQRDTRTAASAGGYAPCVLRCFFFAWNLPRILRCPQMSPDAQHVEVSLELKETESFRLWIQQGSDPTAFFRLVKSEHHID